MIAIAIVCVVFNIYRTLKVDELLEDLLSRPDQYSDFNFLSYGQSQFDNAIAIAVFLAWIKVSCKVLSQLSSKSVASSEISGEQQWVILWDIWFYAANDMI